MLIDHWPLQGLSLQTPDLELRLPDNEDLAALADVAAAGIHDSDFMPFLVPWTAGSPAEVARSVVLHHWKIIGSFDVQDWRIPFTVFYQGMPVGVQTIRAKNFAVTREVATGSWLGKAYHGRGIGTQMRVAVLEFAFAGLGAQSAISAALVGNAASLGVSRKLGYREDGIGREEVQGKLRVDQRLRLDKEQWSAPFGVPMKGLEKVLEFLGL